MRHAAKIILFFNFYNWSLCDCTLCVARSTT